jgi:Zn-dependent protease with chaperone function
MIALTALDDTHVYVDVSTGLIVRMPRKREYAADAGAVIVMNGYACAVKETPEQVKTIIEAAK